jgi:hypothetical protein
MLSSPAPLNDWVRLIRAEYAEFPGLHLTRPQMRRLWSLDESTCEGVIEALEGDGFLRRTASGGYVRAD